MPRDGLTSEQLEQLAAWDTPTIANALELCSDRSVLEGYNVDEARDFMPEMPTMVGYAVTLEYCASRPPQPSAMDVFERFGRMVAASAKPAVLVVRDVDSPRRTVGAGWGECTANFYRALGAIGVIVDGAVRDRDGMVRAGFRVLARRLAVSHGQGQYLQAGEPVEVFGTTVCTGNLIAADQHGFITIPDNCAERVAEAAAHVVDCERRLIIEPTHQPGFSVDTLMDALDRFERAMAANPFKEGAQGEWTSR